MDAIKELKDFLDWNRYMTLGITLWAVLVGIVVVNCQTQICTEANPFPGVILVVGLAFTIMFPCLEFWTDYIQYKNTSTRLIRKTKDESSPPKADKRSLGGFLVRFSANLFVFYLAVGITSFGWIDDTQHCFFPFPIEARKWALIGAAIAEILLLLVRIGCFDYEEEKPKNVVAHDDLPPVARIEGPPIVPNAAALASSAQEN